MRRKLSRKCTAWRNHNPVISSFMISHRIFRENKQCMTFWRRICLCYFSENMRSLPVLFCGVRVYQSFVVFLVFCKSLLVFLLFPFFPCLRRLCQFLRLFCLIHLLWLMVCPFAACDKPWVSLYFPNGNCASLRTGN